MELAPEEVVADKGYHSNETMKDLVKRSLRSYVSEPRRGRRSWKKNKAAQAPTYANRRRIKGNRGRALLRRRGDLLERGFAHMLVTGGMRRVHLRGQVNIRKRMLIHAGACNLGLVMRTLFRVGTPRGLQWPAAMHSTPAQSDANPIFLIQQLLARLWPLLNALTGQTLGRCAYHYRTTTIRNSRLRSETASGLPLNAAFATDC